MNPRLGLVAVLLVVASACGSGAGDGSAGPGGGDGQGLVDLTDATAELAVLESGVDVAQSAATQDFRVGEDGEGLLDGNLVRTTATGFAEVRWVDGALSRVDVNSLFTVVSLEVEAGEVSISTRVDGGRTWHRVQPGATDRYEVQTAVGVAAVRGTAFAVNCAESCVFALVEGHLEVTTTLGVVVDLLAGEQVEVAPTGEIGPIEPIDRDDPWIAQNVDLDDGTGFPEPEPTAEPRDDNASARLDGDYDVEVFTTDSNNEPTIGGGPFRQEHRYEPACDEGPCGGTWFLDPIEQYEWTGNGYVVTWLDRLADVDVGCRGIVQPSHTSSIRIEITPTATVEVDGQLVVSAFDYAYDRTLTPLPEAEAAGCLNFEGPIMDRVEGTGVRTG